MTHFIFIELSSESLVCWGLWVEITRTITKPPELHETWEDKEFVVEFDFLGKDSIRYQNWVAVNKRVFKNLKIFVKDKDGGL